MNTNRGHIKLNQLLKLALVALISVVISACQSMNSTVGGYFDLDTDLQIDFIVDADINPDELDRASPLFVRLYELKTRKMMKKSDFIEIYERDKEVLGADMVAVHKLKRFKPGESRTEHFVLDKETHFVALYAEFFEFKGSNYKLIIPVVANNVFRNSVVIRILGNELIFDEAIDEDMDEAIDEKSAESSGFKKDAGKVIKSSDKTKEFF